MRYRQNWNWWSLGWLHNVLRECQPLVKADQEALRKDSTRANTYLNYLQMRIQAANGRAECEEIDLGWHCITLLAKACRENHQGLIGESLERFVTMATADRFAYKPETAILAESLILTLHHAQRCFIKQREEELKAQKARLDRLDDYLNNLYGRNDRS